MIKIISRICYKRPHKVCVDVKCDTKSPNTDIMTLQSNDNQWLLISE